MTVKRIKKALYLILAISMMLSAFSSPLFAASGEVSTVQPRWANVGTINLVICFDEPAVGIVVNIASAVGTTYTDGIITLEKITGYGAGTVWTWNDLSSEMPFFYFSDKSAPRYIGTYRLTVTITTHGPRGTETVTADMEKTY